MDDNSGFVRWQGNTNAQLGYVVGLILSLTTASLGFAVISLERLLSPPPQCMAAAFFALSIVVLVISGALAIVCTATRLRDFRKTTRIARLREKWEGQKIAEFEIKHKLFKRRVETKKLGRKTWRLFCCQLLTFSFGMALLFLGVAFQFVPSICRLCVK